MIGRVYAHPKAVSFMTEHSVARAKYSPVMRSVFRFAGPAIIRFFGYPLDMEIQRRVRPVIKLLKPEREDVVLDVGCGVGYFTFELSKSYGSFAVGLDIDEEDIALADKVKNINRELESSFVAGSGLTLPFKNASFDKVLASEIIEHIHADSFFLKELSRVLKEGGTLVLTTPYDTHPVEFKHEHYKNVKKMRILGGHVRSGYNLKSLSEKFGQADLTVDDYVFSHGGYTKLARKIIKRFHWFGAPIAWVVSSIEDSVEVKEGKCIIVSARKKEPPHILRESRQ
jgi:ubiquinone/menaquinone biosynthesis C-methylase UbiE